ncbi:hypothetical protein ASA1KI_14330 [Opitutales bacterium ASA1]|uniref:hypothetical protein n=1 Tax=Congregicoccus parvus TaxID=3081749 RepID=UPI002B313B8E|nr:hypothetical protein ASA1KI_14330 [Opitutales bacterium ASA1]
MKTSRFLLTLSYFGLLLAATATAATSEVATTKKKGPPPDAEAMRAYHQKVLSIYDEDGDGRLDEIERAVLQADIAEGKMEAPPAGPRGGRGRGGPPPEIVAQYDADGDGVLNETEHAALRADIEAGKVSLPMRPEGRGPRGGKKADTDSDIATES